MANEALASFTSLLDNVPGWIVDLDNILTAASVTQDTIIQQQQPSPLPMTLSAALPKPRKSLKSKVSKASLKEAMNRANAYLRPQKRQPITPSDALHLSQRKRKTESICSGNRSGPADFRNTAHVVVYYDGDTQKRIEKLVRAVGASRNAIRKGKMSAKVDALARTGSSSSEASNSSGGEDNDISPIPHRLSYKTTRSESLPAFGRCDDIAVFDRVDAQLEKAQTLCERAAHQILRDGDCTVEARDAREHFDSAFQMAQAELPALQKKAERAAEREQRHREREARQRAEDEAAEQKRKSAAELAQKIMAAVAASSPPQSAPESDILEVDDSSDTEDEEFDISAMRFTKMAHMRSSTRLAAY